MRIYQVVQYTAPLPDGDETGVTYLRCDTHVYATTDASGEPTESGAISNCFDEMERDDIRPIFAVCTYLN